MNIGIVISGESRSIEKGYNSLYNSIIKDNNVTIYFHTWKSKEYDIVLNYYNASCGVIQQQIDFSFFNNNKTIFDIKSLNISSAFYSQQKICNLVKQDLYNFDFIIRTRFDLYYYNSINFNNLCNNNIYVANNHWPNSVLFDDCLSIYRPETYIRVYEDIYDSFIKNNGDYIDRAEQCKYNHYSSKNLIQNIQRTSELNFTVIR